MNRYKRMAKYDEWSYMTHFGMSDGVLMVFCEGTQIDRRVPEANRKSECFQWIFPVFLKFYQRNISQAGECPLQVHIFTYKLAGYSGEGE